MSNISVVVLIISTESNDHNKKCEVMWRERMDYYKKIYPNVDYYFLKARPDIDKEYHIENNNFYLKAEEIPYVILLKTLKAFEVLSPNYDYTLRTNISSVILMDRYLKWLSLHKPEKLYAGVPHPHGHTLDGPYYVYWAFGAAYTISKDVAYQLSRPEMLNVKCVNPIHTGTYKDIGDDVFVGYICLSLLKLRFIVYKYVHIWQEERLPYALSYIDKDTDVFFIRIKLYEHKRHFEAELQHEINQKIKAGN